MFLVILWVGLAFVIGHLAGKRGRSGWGWLLLALVISPLLAGLILALAGTNTEAIAKEQIATGQMRKCPQCAELIKFEAVKCRYCGSDVAMKESAEGDADPIDAAGLMAKYAIEHVGGKYRWRIWSYDFLEDAVAYAKKTLAEERAKYG